MVRDLPFGWLSICILRDWISCLSHRNSPCKTADTKLADSYSLTNSQFQTSIDDSKRNRYSKKKKKRGTNHENMQYYYVKFHGHQET